MRPKDNQDRMTLFTLIFSLCACAAVTSADTPSECGRNRYDGSKRIVGGVASKENEWPWLVSVMVSFNGHPREHVCGATLIHPQWVISGAHCFHAAINASLTDNPDDYTLRIGEHNLYDDDGDHIDVRPTFITKYNYDFPNSFHNDIALVKLPNPVEVTEQVNVACLPSETDTFPDSCTVAGWGHQEEDGAVSPVVRHVEVDFVDIEKCEQLYVDLAQYFPTWDGCLCAGDLKDGNRDACQFDSGGPLVCKTTSNPSGPWVLAGVVSGGTGCGSKELPGVYTKVQHYLQWIEDTIRDN